MQPKIYKGLLNLEGNLLTAIDFETTGLRPDWHEIIQIAVLPLNSNLEPFDDIIPFYTTIRPLHPERASKTAGTIHGLSLKELVKIAPPPDTVSELLHSWFENLHLPARNILVPLAHNWAFEAGFLTSWLGVEGKSELFHAHARDTMTLAIGINDRASMKGEIAPFRAVNLQAMCKALHVINTNPHDALSDCLAEAEVYKKLIKFHL